MTDTQLKFLQEQLAEQQRKTRKAQQAELALRHKAEELDARARELDLEIVRRLDEKMEMLYEYLSGDEFRHRVEAIVETFCAMREQLERERRAMEKLWKEREKQIERLTINTVGMYGEMRGAIGQTMPPIAALELDPVGLLMGNEG